MTLAFHTKRRMTLAATLITILSVSVTTIPATGATIVAWGGDYIGSANSGDNLTAGGWNAGLDRFNSITPAAYTGPEIGGRLSGTNTNTEMINVSPRDRIDIKGISWALVLFQKNTFLEQGDLQQVNFDGGSQVEINVNTEANRVNRLVIRSGSNYYISGDIITGTGSKMFTPTTVEWFNYDPINDATTIGSATTVVSNGQISDITAVGVFSANPSGSEAFRFDRFQVTGAIIPEPTSLALLALGGLLMVPRRSRG